MEASTVTTGAIFASQQNRPPNDRFGSWLRENELFREVLRIFLFVVPLEGRWKGFLAFEDPKSALNKLG